MSAALMSHTANVTSAGPGSAGTVTVSSRPAAGVPVSTSASRVATRLQDPIPLTVYPFRVTLPPSLYGGAGRNTSASRQKDKAGKRGKGKVESAVTGAADAKKRHPTPSFLCAASPHKSNSSTSSQFAHHPNIVVTVQSSGLYIYNSFNQQCLHSFSVPPAVTFACPARCITLRSTTSSTPPDQKQKKSGAKTAAMDVDGEEDNDFDDMEEDDNGGASPADVPVAPTASRKAFRLFAAIATAPDLPDAEAGRHLWMWDTASSSPSENGTVSAAGHASAAPGKPTRTMKLARPAHHLAVHHGDRLIVTCEDGGVVVIGRDLEKVARSLMRPAAKGRPKATAVWTDAVHSKSAPLGSTTRVITVLALHPPEGAEGEGMRYAVRVVVATTDGAEAGADIDMEGSEDASAGDVAGLPRETELDTDLAEIEIVPPRGAGKPVAFALEEKQTRLFVTFASGDVAIYNLDPSSALLSRNKNLLSSSNMSIKSLNLSLDPVLADDGDVQRGPAPLGMKALDGAYLAVVGRRTRKGQAQDVLSVWDTRYGTLQVERVLNAEEIDGIEASKAAIDFSGRDRGGVGKVYHMDIVFLPQVGPSLSVSVSDLDAIIPLSFSSTASLIPFYCPPLTLLAAIGKLHGNSLFEPALLPAGNQDVINPLSLGLVAIPPVGLFPKVLAASGDGDHISDAEVLAAWMTSLRALDELDRTHVARMIQPGVTRTSEQFWKDFVKWIDEKDALANPGPAVVSKGDSAVADDAVAGNRRTISVFTPFDFRSGDDAIFQVVPRVEVAQPAMQALLARIVSTDDPAFYPHEALRYLIRTRRATNHVTAPQPVSGSKGRGTRTVVECVLDKGDVVTLALILSGDKGWLPDVTESELALMLARICGPPTQHLLPLADMDRFAYGLHKGPKKLAKSWGLMLTGRKEGRTDLGWTSDGRSWFVVRVLAMPRNDVRMAMAMKKALGVECVESLLKWCLHVMEKDRAKHAEVSEAEPGWVSVARELRAQIAHEDPSLRRQLWWLWKDDAGDHNAMLFDVAVSLMSLVVDSHLPVLLLTPSLEGLLTKLSGIVSADLKVMSLVERKLKGCLSPFVPGRIIAKGSTEATEKEGAKEVRTRWKRMVQDVQDGVGKYAVEVFTI
ncbi:hypothetical protein HK101_007805 [Irineochytrium annulatum]|nr:hypothetical protein HK101_007805 [Irineochytrium annulatum]